LRPSPKHLRPSPKHLRPSSKHLRPSPNHSAPSPRHSETGSLPPLHGGCFRYCSIAAKRDNEVRQFEMHPDKIS
jgi:hypothetical protein